MSAMLEHKGYFGSVEYSAEDGVLHGRLEFIRDLVTYEGKDAKEIRAAFQEAVDDYLELCEAEGRKADVTL
jgi:predicted HicB family RNase H-like nuclease